MAKNILWSPKNHNNLLYKFSEYLYKKKIIKNKNYNTLHKWSIINKKEFWKEIWNFTNIKGELKKPIITNEKNFLKSIFFKKSKLNYTENLIKKKDNSDALIFYSEQRLKRKISWKELDLQVSKISNYLIGKKINKGDRVAGVLPNIPETVISFLAVSKIGGIWSSCSADFGAKAIIDRFKQIKPKLLIVSDYYFYNNKKIDTLKKITEIKNQIPTIQNIVVIPYENKKVNYKLNFRYDNWLNILKSEKLYEKYKKFDFNTPLYILYSSGTTGAPKCIVHGAGNSLIQHKKEHQLHCNILDGDKVFYFTTCGWMMWNWLVSALASNASIVLYDGSPFFPNDLHLFNIIEKENITFFGTGAKYIDMIKNKKIKINKNKKLKKLKTIASTGSPLVHESFNYIYKNIKKNIHLTSISGGTDIVSCFVLGNPNMPVYSGEIQCKGLGMDVAVFNDKGKEIKYKKGELICKTSFPSKPLFFWNDKNNKKYLETYFHKFKNIWFHGDFIKNTVNNGYIIYGRSDSTLNSGGIRIGTSEIYRVVENIEGIVESIAVEQKYNNDTRIILFLKLKEKLFLNKRLKDKINKKIKSSLSPKHVPSIILNVKDIPKTKSGKIVELTIKKIVNNEPISNLSSLINPECIKEYREKVKNLN